MLWIFVKTTFAEQKEIPACSFPKSLPPKSKRREKGKGKKIGSLGKCQTGLKNFSKGKQSKLYILTLKYEVTKLVWPDYLVYMSASPLPQGLPFWLCAVSVALNLLPNTQLCKQDYHEQLQKSVRFRHVLTHCELGCHISWDCASPLRHLPV